MVAPAMICGWFPYMVNQASVGTNPRRCIPGMNSRTTNSKYSCSRPGKMSQDMSNFTVTVMLLIGLVSIRKSGRDVGVCACGARTHTHNLQFSDKFLALIFQNHDSGFFGYGVAGYFQRGLGRDLADAPFFLKIGQWGQLWGG